MQANCPDCNRRVDLFPSYVIARNANPDRKPEVQICCPRCGDVFRGANGQHCVECQACRHRFDPGAGPAKGAKATCPHCAEQFTILEAVGRQRPPFRMYAKLVLTADGRKEYLRATDDDLTAYSDCSRLLHTELAEGRIRVPALRLSHGFNTRQAMSYGFTAWTDFFNDRQLLALGWLRAAIEGIEDAAVRGAIMTLFSGVLEFNNLFASYKGEGTGAVRHMFSHHILKPERTPIEANVWGTPRSSGSFCSLFKSRLLRAIDYREAPTEVDGRAAPGRLCSKPFSGRVETEWPITGRLRERDIYLSVGDSSQTGLADQSVDIVATDPPFFDNVHYSELADFFYAWRQIGSRGAADPDSTRSPAEVQDTDPDRFAAKLRMVFAECHRVLKDDGIFVFTYHHSRNEGWHSLAEATFGAGFVVVNSQPVKAEMSVATPKAQAKEPIQLDIILVCRKAAASASTRPSPAEAFEAGRTKIRRLEEAGFALSRNDRRIVLFGQVLTALAEASELAALAPLVDDELAKPCQPRPAVRPQPAQSLLF